MQASLARACSIKREREREGGRKRAPIKYVPNGWVNDESLSACVCVCVYAQCYALQCMFVTVCNTKMPNSKMNVCLDANVMLFYLVWLILFILSIFFINAFTSQICSMIYSVELYAFFLYILFYVYVEFYFIFSNFAQCADTLFSSLAHQKPAQALMAF